MEGKKCFPVSNYLAKMIRFVLNESCYEAAIVERMSQSIDCLPPSAPAGERLLMAVALAGMYGWTMARQAAARLMTACRYDPDTVSCGLLPHRKERKAKQRANTTQLHLVIYSHIVNTEMYSLQTRQPRGHKAATKHTCVHMGQEVGHPLCYYCERACSVLS